jgi:hypothetical protein
MGEQVEMTTIPMCDLNKQHGKAAYDSRLPKLGGSWAYVCEACFREYGPGRVGTGNAQRLIQRSQDA